MCFCTWSFAKYTGLSGEKKSPLWGAGWGGARAGPAHMRSSSASRAAAISSASELLPSSSQLDSLLDSLATSSSFSFLLWPLEDKRALRGPARARGPGLSPGHTGLPASRSCGRGYASPPTWDQDRQGSLRALPHQAHTAKDRDVGDEPPDAAEKPPGG